MGESERGLHSCCNMCLPQRGWDELGSVLSSRKVKPVNPVFLKAKKKFPLLHVLRHPFWNGKLL